MSEFRTGTIAFGLVLMMCMTALGGLAIVGSDESDALNVSYTVRTGDWMMTEMDETTFDMSTSAGMYLSGLSSSYYFVELDPPGINAYFYADCPTGTYTGSWYAVNDESGDETFYENITVTVVAGGPYKTGITHLVMGASNVPESQVVENYNTSPQTFTISSAIPTKSGMAFLGYSTSYGSSQVVYQPGDTVTVRAGTTVYLYPVFGSLFSHTVAYDANGGSGTMGGTTVSDSNNGNTSVTLASCGFTKSGYHFIGWKIGNTVYQPGQTVPVGANASVTATAQWEQNTLTLGTVAKQYAVAGKSVSFNASATSNPSGATITFAKSNASSGLNVSISGNVVTCSAANAGTYTFTLTAIASGYTSSSTTVTVQVVPVLAFTNSPSAGALNA